MKMRKIIAVMAAVLMLLSILPMAVFAADTQIVFNLGANGSASHSDGSEKTTYSETVDGYTLSFTGMSKAYTGARDAKGNSCIKLGTKSAVGKFSFTVPEDVTSVIIAAAKYKTNTSKLSVNGTTHTLSGASDSGVYDAITVDTTSTKTISVTSVSGGYRVMVNTITFVVAAAGGDEPECDHDWVDATCTEAKTCSICGDTEGEALGHSYGEATETVAPDCTTAGEKQSTCSACGDVKKETVKALGHTFVDGFCSVCNEPQPLEATITFDNKDKRTEYTTTIQVWKENGITVTNNKASSTTNVGDYANPVRLYAKSSVTIEYPGMTKIDFVCNASSYVTPLKNSIGTNANVTTNGNTVTLTLGSAVSSYTIAQLTAQVQLKSITVYGSACKHDYVGVETQAPTCSAEGVMTYTCSKCSESYTEAIATIPHSYVEDIIDSTCTTTGTKTYECSVCFDSYDEVIPVKNHNYVDDVCADCGHVKAYKGTITFDADKTQRTECTTSVQKWENGGLTFINNKAGSTTNINSDYYGRFYKNSTIIIEFPEMSKLIIDANVEDRADYAWGATLEAAGLTYTEADGIYTITFDEPKNSLELTCANQVRANSITAIVAHDCAYDHAFDVDCSKCGDIREVSLPITSGGKSASEDVSGLAFLFNIDAEGISAVIGETEADYTNATLNGYKLISMGAIASNGSSSVDIPAKWLCELSESSASYAVRVVNIPEKGYDTQITAVPYFVVEIDGEQVTIKGEAVTGTYNGVTGDAWS